MRGFFAFAVRPDFTSELVRLYATLPHDPGLRPLHPGDLHVTIKFLSEFSSTRFFECLGELCELGRPPGHSLTAGKLALWPTVLALECEPSEELRAWHGRVNGLLERKGFLKERHPVFRPHVTLARLKPFRRPGELEGQLKKAENSLRGRSVPLEAPALWRTQAEGTGRSHTPLLSPLFRGP